MITIELVKGSTKVEIRISNKKTGEVTHIDRGNLTDYKLAKIINRDIDSLLQR